MKNIILFIVIFASLCIASCKTNDNPPAQKKMVATAYNPIHTDISLLEKISTDDPQFRERLTAQDFDHIVTFLGTRNWDDRSDSIKVKMFMWGNKVRGYYHPIELGKDISFFGFRDGTKVALKTLSDNHPHEDAVNLTGNLAGDNLELVYSKGLLSSGTIKSKVTERKYPIIFYETKDY